MAKRYDIAVNMTNFSYTVMRGTREQSFEGESLASQSIDPLRDHSQLMAVGHFDSKNLHSAKNVRKISARTLIVNGPFRFASLWLLVHRV